MGYPDLICINNYAYISNFNDLNGGYVQPSLAF